MIDYHRLYITGYVLTEKRVISDYFLSGKEWPSTDIFSDRSLITIEVDISASGTIFSKVTWSTPKWR